LSSGCGYRDSCTTGSTCGFPIFCSKDIALQISSLSGATQDYNLTISPITYQEIVDNQKYTIASTTLTKNFQFNLPAAKSLILTVTPDNNVRVAFYAGCTLKTSRTCNSGSGCVYRYVYEGEAVVGKYWIVITPTTTTSTAYTLDVSTGLNNCYNVSLNLNFCKNYLSTSQLYSVRDVTTAENTAESAYLAFSAIYNNTCSENIKNFVCNYNFQACDGTGLTKKLCREDCEKIVTLCGTNPCVKDVCTQFSTCTNIPTGGTTGSGTTGSGTTGSGTTGSGTTGSGATGAGTAVSTKTQSNSAIKLITSILILIIVITL